MAKENQEIVGEVDEMPENDSGIEGAERENESDDDHAEGEGVRLEDTGDVLEDSTEASDEVEHDRLVSAPPSLAMWLADELRPSPSKSTPPKT